MMTGKVPATRFVFFSVMAGLLIGLGLVSILLSAVRLGMASLPDNGYQAFCTRGTSMEPYSYDGDLIIVRLGEMPQSGRNMVFWKGEGADAGLVFHRTLYEVYAESGGYVTKGDNNELADSGEVGYDDVVGSEVWHGPGLGWLAPRGDSDVMMLVCGVLDLGCAFFCLLFASGRADFVDRRRP